MKEAQFTVMLTSEDGYRHHHVRFRRDILGFVVQYETRLEGKCERRWTQICLWREKKKK